MTTVPRSHLIRGLATVAILAAAGAGILFGAGRGSAQRPAPAASTHENDSWTGKPAPAFLLHTLGERGVKLSDFRGRVVLLNFWATWCAPCRVEMPWLVDFYSRYQSQGLEIVGVSVDDDPRDKVAAFVHARNVNYTIVLKDEGVADAYGGLRFLPQTFFIGRDGNIVKHTVGVRGKEDFENDIRQALGTAQPSA
jgi:peroxiredoxin